ncbi:RNA deprotection pyrophosphohydrolase [Anaerobacillus isosaccharinicus]|uniref:Nucleoside triphosphatase YtkD n=1 Tax=Anaerobacillus isosaccharinicus TaxID=1532552 RepID=A0A1S2LB72_9BACI|nr:nucleoside triphosphatase YtkD [Anaerobacillus isosaccharinicus]MBA5588104.1 nucleoside triphosphatase YtkD [Anaerobacillus isosaccharinicus]QOY38607.1 nucleoside triphosphatase YtkD [Anaerobacillus isosaccharinicus]
MFSFIDFYKNTVEFSFNHHHFSNNPKHVWVICKWKEDWLLTRHMDRGIEFPGGKVEAGETPEKAAVREVYEETGGIVDTLTYIGQYRVTAKQEVVIKNVYFAEIKGLDKKDHYYETAGPTLLRLLPRDIKGDKQFSFIMKDEVLQYSMEWVEKNLK